MKRIITILLLFTLTACSHVNPLVKTPKYPPQASLLQDINVALVLGGGGSKGAAHLGVLKVFEENNIPIDLIVGCSAGAAIGALYADHLDAEKVKNILLSVRKNDLLDTSIADFFQMLVDLKGPVRGYFYQKFLQKNLRTKNLESLKIPTVVVTTDVLSNNIYAMRTGPIVSAVHASSAIPPLFTPVKIYGKILVDGGVKSPVPVRVAKQYGPKVIIAVDISAPPPYEGMHNMFDLAYRSYWIFYYELAKYQRKEADIIIHPNMNGYGTFDDGKTEDLYKVGINAANNVINEIKLKLAELNIPLKNNKSKKEELS